MQEKVNNYNCVIAFIIVYVSSFSNALAQSHEEPFKVLRHEEDYSYLKNDTNKLKLLDRIKYIDFHSGFFLSIGGELRYQYEHYKNEDWGDVPSDDKNGYLLQRVMLHADFKFKNYVSVFAQLKSGIVYGKETPVGPPDKNELDFHQLYLEAIPWQDSTRKLMLRAGRFELLYGTGRLIAVSDMPNNRINFQGGLIRYNTPQSNTEMFLVRPVLNKMFVFDDLVDYNAWLGGVYHKNNLTAATGGDIYYFYSKKDSATFEKGTARQVRHTIGAKYYSKYKKYFNYDLEFSYQFGSFGNKPISSYYFSNELSYALANVKTVPTFTFGSNIIAGNDNNRRFMGTFDALYPRPYFGLAAPIGPANLINLHPGFRFYPKKRLIIAIEFDWMWRYSTDDALYNPSVDISRPDDNSDSRFVGTQYILECDYQINRNFSMLLGYSVCPPGGFISDTGNGKVLFFLLARISYKF
ncbi:hypothetical protein A4H97_30120 [Niastella yeongjuensis]|uniref:Alginate export domain-containing protein n=1 Tax=Niastella yeongjuensis TaxID=354355 RepID=A0A1V9EPN4_9BACT|nr:alginate export family protein [Niastella yeongjuensis]OQP48090.1 hypothetical protein A4H97_30120 [Niastella yeongjuensis]SEO26328.1 Alginate export [Niastella yeongjuensis]